MTGRLKSPPLSLLASVLLFGVLWWLDFPKPYSDDLFYAGAGLHMADGGDFSNPTLDRQQFPCHLFLIYPPLHSYALFAWLKIFGISARAMTGFQIACYLVITVSTIFILRRHDASPPLEWLAPLGVCAAFLPIGLRSDAFGTALVMAGFALLECGWRRGPWLFTAFLLLFLGPVGAPRALAFALAIVLLETWKLWRANSGSGWARWSFLGVAACALAVAVLIFLALIGFRLSEFLTAFHFHTTRTDDTPMIPDLVKYFIGVLSIFQLPLLLFPLFLAWLAVGRPRGELTVAGLVVLAALPLAIVVGPPRHTTFVFWWMVLGGLLLAGAVLKDMPRRKSMLLQAAFALILLVADRKIIAESFGILSGAIDIADHGGQYEAARALRPTTEHPLIIDDRTARYVYNYHLPEGAINFWFGARFPGLSVLHTKLRPGDIYAIGPETYRWIRENSYLEGEPPLSWKCFGLEKLSFEKYPRRVFIVPAEKCKASRAPQMS